MKYSLNFSSEVENDLISNYNWYEEKTRGTGDEFLLIFYACAQQISRNPFLYRPVYNDFRRLLLR